MNSGYIGYSMSVRAKEAYENGEKPLSKWTKAAILAALKEARGEEFVNAAKGYPLAALKKVCLEWASWHHTSKHFNKTDFYQFRNELKYCVEYDDINVFIEELNCSLLHVSEPADVECWEVEYDEWIGSRNHGRFKTCSDVGVIKGKWFIGKTGKRKLATGKHFRKIKYLGKYEVWRPNPNLGKNKGA